MNASVNALRRVVPAELVRLVGPYLGRRIRFSGNYRCWTKAAEQACGYESAEILERVKQATVQVRGSNGRKFERDGVVVDDAEMPFALIAALLRVASANGGRLRVFDYGGSLGSSFYQCSPFLRDLKSRRWLVIEQPHFVECGKRHFEDHALAFASTFDEALREGDPDVILFSGVLQYLEKPQAAIRQAIDLRASAIVIDRTPVLNFPHSRIAIQRVPSRLGKSSYPIWLFSRNDLLQGFAPQYRLLAQFPALDGVMSYRCKRVEFKGFILERTDAS